MSCRAGDHGQESAVRGADEGPSGQHAKCAPLVEAIVTQQLTDCLENLKNQEHCPADCGKGDSRRAGAGSRAARPATSPAQEISWTPRRWSASSRLHAAERPKTNELFIVEGDSAGGSAKQGRDRRFQAILPLRGKPLNAEKKRHRSGARATRSSARSSPRWARASTRISTSTSLKYNKVIILSDADQDGAHIRAILLTFFFRYMRELDHRRSCLYRNAAAVQGSKGQQGRCMLTTTRSWPKCIKEAGKGYTLQRYKGLGEMNPEQLWATTMDPSNRKLMQVTIEDAAQAEPPHYHPDGRQGRAAPRLHHRVRRLQQGG